MDRAQRPFYVLLILAFLGGLGWGSAVAGPQGAVFALFAFLVVGGSLVCVWERSVVRSAFSLLATFGGTAGLFALLGADFLAMAQVLIYVGGILALILFGVMLTPPDLSERKLPRVLGGLALMGAAVAFVAARVASSVTWAGSATPAEEPVAMAREIGVGFLAADRYVVAFELAAVLLTVALVAAVYIARRRRVDLEQPDAAADRRQPLEGGA